MKILKTLQTLFTGVDYEMPGSRYDGPFEPLSPAEQEIEQNLRSHIHVMAHEIGPRSIFQPPAYRKTINYINYHLSSYGLFVKEQRFNCMGGEAMNIISTSPYADPEGGEIHVGYYKPLIVGAHFDTIEGTRGANDNGTGVAALLEIGRLLQTYRRIKPIGMVFFTNEEPPFFGTKDMGSRQYVKELKRLGTALQGMICLETLGYYSEEMNSQHVPDLIAPIYTKVIDPKCRGNFIGFFSNWASAEFLKETVGHFRATTQFPSEGVASNALAGTNLSDHASFWAAGYPALMVTDTAMMRYPHYHTADDTEDKINFPHFARVVAGLLETIIALTKV